jgi:hypothetical protein
VLGGGRHELDGVTGKVPGTEKSTRGHCGDGSTRAEKRGLARQRLMAVRDLWWADGGCGRLLQVAGNEGDQRPLKRKEKPRDERRSPQKGECGGGCDDLSRFRLLWCRGGGPLEAAEDEGLPVLLSGRPRAKRWRRMVGGGCRSR